MAAFDHYLTFYSKSSQVWEAIEHATRDLRVIQSFPGLILAVADDTYGYVYLLRPTPGNTTVLRCLASPVASVEVAFSGRTPRNAVSQLLQTSDAESPAIAAAAAGQMRDIRAYIDGATVKPIFVERLTPPHGEPWNPVRLAAFTFLGTPLGSGLALAMNWRRLGKDRWVKPTAITTLLLPIATVAVIWLSVRVISNVQLAAGLMGAMLGLTLALPFAVAAMQRKAYRQWEDSQDFSSIPEHPYSIRPALLTGGAIAIVGTVILTLILNFYAPSYRAPGQSFRSSDAVPAEMRP